MPKGIPKSGVNKGWVKKGQTGASVPNWKGNQVKYRDLHKWVREHKKSNKKCEDCLLVKKLDLANVSGDYKRDLNDWRYLCRKCHMLSDGRHADLMNRNINHNPKKKHGNQI